MASFYMSDLRSVLDQMGVETPICAEHLLLGDDLQFDTLEIRRLRQIIEIRFGVHLPLDFRISRKDTLQNVADKVNQALSNSATKASA